VRRADAHGAASPGHEPAPDEAPASFAAAHVRRAGTIHLRGDPPRVFPFFTPEGERRWVPGWDPAHRHPADGTLQAGGVFVTRAEAEPETVWLVMRHDPAAHDVAYARITPGIRAGVVEVRCEAAPGGGTWAHVVYTLTALSPRGNEVLGAFTEDRYAAMLADWEAAVNGCLAGGGAD
jgi:hypothetical protein